MTENGYGKRTSLTEYPVKGRGAKGVLTAKLTAKKGGLAGARVVREGQELIFISQTGMVQRTAAGGISRHGPPDAGRPGDEPEEGRPGQRRRARGGVDENGNGNGAVATEARVEDEAPTAETVAEEAAAAEAAGNGEAKVTKSSRLPSAGAPKTKPKPKPKPAAKPKAAPKKRSSSAPARRQSLRSPR